MKSLSRWRPLAFAVLLLATHAQARPSIVTDSSIQETSTSTQTSTKLRHLQIVFRHGDRAPRAPLFPNDPFTDESTYWPHGLGQLTNTGRTRSYRFGQWIRDKYGHYLGDRFSPREVFARSSAIDRCVASTQLVLAGKKSMCSVE